MNKLLRYSFVALMAMFLGNAFAQKTVTIDFDNDYQTLFPTLKGVSSGSGDSYVGDGDFTEATTSTPVDGVMVIVAPAEDASNPSRIWASSPRLRMYSGTFTVLSSGLPITKIEFNAHSKNFNLKPTDGSLSEERVFTGATMSAIFMVEKNTQISSIVVTLGEGGTTPDNPDNPNNSGLLAKFDLTSGSIADNGDQTVFEFTGLAKMGESEENKINVSGKVLFDFENEICSACKAFVTFPSEVIAALAEIDAKANAEKEGYDSVERDGATLIVVSSRDFLGYSRILIKSMIKMLIDNEQGGLGILESPMSPNQANIFAGSLEKDKVYDQDIYIKGKIASIKYEFSAQYGTATFFISADGQNDFTFQCYSVNYLENKAWVEGNTQIKVGDEVIICGKVVNYKGNTPETSSKKAYIYSLNGKTKEEGGEDPDPQITSLTVAAALDIINGLEDGKTTAEEYEVKGFVVGAPDFQRKADGSLYGNVNFAIADEKGGATTLTVFRAKDFDNASFTEETINRIKEGDEVVVHGKLQKYVKNGVMTPELTSCYLISVTSAATEGKVWDFTKWSDATIANLKADAAASKTAGWSDVEKKDVAEADGEPTETSKDNCFWSVAEPNADGTLSANGVVIEELKGLVWNSTYSTARSLAIAVNYPVALSEYAGGAYLWLGGGKKKIPCFTIPDVKAGSTITMEVESHKTSEGRGVELYTGLDADNLVDAATKIGDTFAPKTKEAHSWTIDKDCDVIVYNTNGCHIYKIEITAGTTAIKALKTAKIGDGYIFNLAGQRVDANYKGVVIKNGQKMILK